MQFFFLFSVLQSCFALAIVGKSASERYLPYVMSWLKKQDLKVNQNDAFTAIQLMFKFIERELIYDEENNEFLQLFAQQIFDASLQKTQYEHYLMDEMEKFESEELKNGVSYFKNMIREKEKLLEQDLKEIEKRKKQKKDRSKQEERLKEIGLLISEIEKGLEKGTSEKLYGLLEKIESKAVMGQFHYSTEYEEIEQYLKGVDFLFKSRNFEQDKFEIVNLISMVKNVLQDLQLNILMKLQDERLEEFEGITFFENSKAAHQQARDYFSNELTQFLENLIMQWENISEMEQQTILDQEQYNKLWQQFILQNNSIIKNINLTTKSINNTLKHMEEDFLLTNKY